MTIYSDISLRASHLKCIGSDSQGFDRISWINVIVGRNNSGKSSLLDLVELATKGDSTIVPGLWHGGIAPSIFIDSTISEADIKQCFPENTSGGALRAPNHFEFGKRFVGARVTARFVGSRQMKFVRIFDANDNNKSFVDDAELASDYLNRVSNLRHKNPFLDKEFRRIAAERNIVPEMDSQKPPLIHGDGTGATDALQQFLNKSELPRELIRTTLLGALNAIFGPDTVFEEILCRQLPDNRWEVYLSEKAKGLVPLSQSGSGLKTVILALCFIHLAPVIDKKPLSEFVMAFEELENNLHPALQRRLITYLAKQAVENSFALFLTTHSSVSIDLLNRNEDAQILHVTHNGTHSSCRAVRAYVESGGVLDDLDVRASDLLQANGIIWVEGPSDRVYLNRWIFLWTKGELVEGNHYQCVFYGGRLLSHLSADDPEVDDDGVSILRVNRNACVVMDSDRKDASDQLNSTKRRVLSEIEAIGGISWVTDGREIENYVPFSALQEWAPGELSLKSAPKPHDSLFDYLDKREPGLGKRYLSKKAVLAEELGVHTTREQLAASPELAGQLERLCDRIRTWNRLREPTPSKI